MKCPKCGAEMHRIGLEQALGENVFVEVECRACHYRLQQPAQKH